MVNPNQIVFQSDPLDQTYFPLNGDVQNITMNVSTWLQTRQDFYNTAYRLGIICLIVGFFIGYFGPIVGKWIKEKYGGGK